MSGLEDFNGFALPEKYRKFLKSIGTDCYYIEDTGITLYPYEEIIERNITYEVKVFSFSSLMIGQDGDMGFFIKKNTGDTVYSLDLGALGSLEMEEEASGVFQGSCHHQAKLSGL